MTDARTTDPKNVAADIAREYREHAERWTQGWYAKTAEGKDCGPTNPNAVCWCLRGAIEKRVGEGDEGIPIFEAFDRALGFQDSENTLHFIAWNDDPERKVSEVIALCEAVASGSTLRNAR